tara:strand:+ start:309 stop:623 length:315 start_codon:yes stop_codon:yes gene_type:complete
MLLSCEDKIYILYNNKTKDKQMKNFTAQEKVEIAKSLSDYIDGSLYSYVSFLGHVVVGVYTDFDLDGIDCILSDWGFDCVIDNKFNNRSKHIEGGKRFGFRLTF